MRRSLLYATAALSALTSLTPADADPYVAASAQHLHAVHLNVYRPLGASAHDRLAGLLEHRTSADDNDPAVELSMNIGKLEVILDTEGNAQPEEGGCIDIIVGSVIDTGCGPLAIFADRQSGTTHVVGEIASTEYEYIADPFSFTEIGPSTISVDLDFVGTGPVERSPYGWSAVGVCGLPPETRGVFVDVTEELTRAATADGELISAAAGPVDVSTFAPSLIDAFGVRAGACV